MSSKSSQNLSLHILKTFSHPGRSRSVAVLSLAAVAFVCLLLPSPMSAQIRRVVTYQTVIEGSMTISVEAFLSDAVDESPRFPGGDSELIKFINNNRRYPVEAYNAGIEGRVLCSFIVDSDGSIVNPEIIRGVEESLNREALRIISRMPRWHAGKIEGISVPVYYILAIPFRR